MAVEINTMPTEVLEAILQCVIDDGLAKSPGSLSSRSSVLGPPPFTSILRVCRVWYGIALPLLWGDVVLGKKRQFTITSTVTPRTAALIRSLTLHLEIITEWVQCMWRIAGVYPAYGRDLQLFAGRLHMMINLTTFSLTFGCLDCWGLPSEVIHSVLEQLPSSVENLQIIATNFMDRNVSGSRHLCAVLGRFLCHAKHVKLCLGMFCPTIFDVVLGVEATGSMTGQPTAPGSRLETAIFDATNMDALKFCPSTAKLDVRSRSDKSYDTAKRAFLERAQECILANKFPALKRFAFFDRLRRIRGSASAIVERNLIKNITTCYPIAWESRPYGAQGSGCSYMCRHQKLNGEDVEIYGEAWQIMDAVACPAWIQTAQGSRFPPEFRNSRQAKGKGYDWRQRSSPYHKRFYPLHGYQDNLERLLHAESQAGRRLLTPRTTEGLFNFEPLHRSA